MSTRLYAVLVLAGFTVGCRDATEPGILVPLHPAFAPAAGSAWAPVASMSFARSQHGSGMGADGRIYVFEGGSSMGPVNSSEVYDPAANAWSSVASPGPWCCGGSTRGGDGRLYLVGGEWDGGADMSRVRAYDPANDSWSDVARLAVQRDVLAAVRGPDGRIYATGGIQEGVPRMTLASIEIYDPAGDSWSEGPSMGRARWFHTGALGPDGKVYVFGGLQTFAPMASAEVFDPATGQWSPIADMPQTRFASNAVTGQDGLIYLVGGVVNGGGDGKSVIAYDPVANSWSDAPSLNVGRTQAGAALGLDGRIFVAGGTDPEIQDNVASVESFETAPPPTNQAPIAVAGLDQALECVAGGADAPLDASGSSDPDQDALSYEWLEGSTLLASVAVATVHLGLGEHLLTLRVTDDDEASASDEVLVSVRDTQAPVLTLTRLTSVLHHRDWRLHRVAKVSASDVCQHPNLGVTVTSNQVPWPELHGHWPDDWKVVPNDAGGLDVYVRAGLFDFFRDRIYTITATASDQSGNSASESTTVRVPPLFYQIWETRVHARRRH